MQRQKLGDGHTNGQSYGQQLAEIHANTLPGVTRTEEGEEMLPSEDLEGGSMAQEALHRNYNDLERSRERERYEDYLDEQDSEKLPSAFDLGWKRNLLHLFGIRNLYWFLPICNTMGDGWHWEPSAKWLDAREEVRRQREIQWRDHEQEPRGRETGTRHERQEGFQDQSLQRWPPRKDSGRHYLTTTNGVAAVPRLGKRSPGKADQVLGRSPDGYFDGDFSDHSPSSRMSMKTLRRRGSFEGSTADEEESYEVSSDEERRPSEHSNGWYDTSKKDSQEGQQRADDEWREWN